MSSRRRIAPTLLRGKQRSWRRSELGRHGRRTGNPHFFELRALSKLSPSTIHIYLNHLEKKGYLQGVVIDRSKAWQLMKSPETIEREASILTNIIDNPAIFIPKMREEAMSQLELLPPEIVQPILSFFKPSREV